MSVIYARKDSPKVALRVLDSIRQADRDMVGRQIIPAPSIRNHSGLSQNASRNPYEARGRSHCAIAKEQPTARILLVTSDDQPPLELSGFLQGEH